MSRGKRRDHYQVLGISRTASDAEVKAAFRELARKVHPDVNPDDRSAGERFREINEAYATLSDPERRARYDRWGHRGPEGAGLGSVAKVVEDVFGDVLRKRRSKQRGHDLRYTLEVSFEEAAFGCSKTIRVGEGDKAREYTVAIPAGTKEGAVRLLPGEGEPGAGGGPVGDLHVIVRVREHPVLRREGHDVLSEVAVTFPQAALGGVIEVPTLDGAIKMRIPEGTQPGRVFRIRGRGMPRDGGKQASRGDHLVRVQVTVPTELSERQRELLLEFTGEPRPRAKSSAPSRRGILDRVRSLLDE
jgi:molecular chaperone DnaJ